MSDSVNQPAKDNRVRLRLSVRPIIAERIDAVAATLGVDENAVAVMALSLGLRVMTAVGGMPDASTANFIQGKAIAEVAGAVADAGGKVQG